DWEDAWAAYVDVLPLAAPPSPPGRFVWAQPHTRLPMLVLAVTDPRPVDRRYAPDRVRGAAYATGEGGLRGRAVRGWPAAAAAPQIRAEKAAQVGLFRCVFGNPFRPVASDPGWRTADVLRLAEAVYAERAFDRLPILADLLEEAGATDAALLAHL